jgi:uncharacterized Zn finger protein
MPRYSRWDYEYFPVSRPIATKGGIKANSRRGQFGHNWWAKRWVEVLESFDVGGRLERGRSYARKGQVLNIDIEPGIVKSQVQGSDPRPYKVEIRLKALTKEDEARLAASLGQELPAAARLLAGDLPEELEDAFRSAGLTLFPEKGSDLQTKCSCPDWSNPCKHVAATYYLMAEEFDRDPFLLLKLRGIDRERLLNLLKQAFPILSLAEPAAPKKSKGETKAAPKAAAKPSLTAPLDALDPEAFWQGGELPVPAETQLPSTDMPLLRRLGAFPFWRGEQPLEEALKSKYRVASQRSLKVAAGDFQIAISEANEV